MVSVALVLLPLAMATPRAFAAPGDLDTRFGDAGEYLPAEASARLTILPAGALLETAVVRGNGTTLLKLRRLAADARRDPGWGMAGERVIDLTTLPPRAADWSSADWIVRPQRDGSLLVKLWLGTSARSSIGGLAALPVDFAIRVLDDGSLDTDYGTRGAALLQDGNTDWVFDAIPQPDGSAIVIQGCSTCDIYASPDRIRRFTADGREDAGFAFRGSTSDAPVGLIYTAVRRDDGIVLVVGAGGVLRVNADGAIDTSTGKAGLVDLPAELTSRLRAATGRSDLTVTIGAAAATRDGRVVLALAIRGPESGGDSLFDSVGVARIDRNGELDRAYGTDGGIGRLSLTRSPWAGERFGGAYMSLVLAGDGAATLRASLYPNDSTSPRQMPIGLARFDAAGRPLPVPGDAGLQWLGIGAAPNLLAAGPADTVLLATESGRIMLRGDAAESPGIVTVGSVLAREASGALRIPLVRASGRRGAVAIEVTSADAASSAQAPAARAGVDYVATTQRVEWADGEDGVKYATIPLLDDTEGEPNERILVGLRTLVGAPVLTATTTTAYILSEEAPAPPLVPSVSPATARPPPGSAGGGGGGALDPALLALLSLLATARASARTAPRLTSSSSGCCDRAGPSCPSSSAAASRAAGRGG